MNRLSLLIGAAALGSISLATSGAQFQMPTQTFTVPDGFVVERVAGPPLVDRPIVADFDELGRLYVADSSGSNDKVEKQLEERPHRIVRLEDTNGDGHFDRSIVFADRMMFPEGAMWFKGSLYVSAPPSIWKLTDTDGDGKADERVEWFQGKTLTGCANDLHGPYLGPDGWIYWCKGAFAKQTYERPGREPFVTRAAHIFRSRPDGTGIEPVMTGGMDNPVDVAFTPGGERIFTTTFFQHPGGGQRDGLIHAIYGGVYGKIHDVIYEHPRTGDVMPVLAHLGPAAPCGFTRYASAVFGAEYQDNFFACLFNLHKVTRHVLHPEGATFGSEDSDFLVSDSTDFHPTDVLEDADGSLLVIDTGGWYKLCCPTSQLWKPDVLGAIYRVRREGARVEDPRGLKLDWDRLEPAPLARLLEDPRPAVYNRAIEHLADKAGRAIPVLRRTLKDSKSVSARLGAVWALTRIEEPAAREVVRSALSDPDWQVRQAALNSISVHRDAGALSDLLELLKAEEPQIRRGAATALGRIGDKRAVPALLEAASERSERTLEHSLTYALIEIGDPEGTAAGLNAASASTQRAALIALDQMKNGGLHPEEIARRLSSPDPLLQQAAAWIVEHRPEWGGELSGFYRKGLQSAAPGEPDAVARQLARFSRSTAIQELLAEVLREYPRQSRLIALRAMADARLKPAPAVWIAELARVLAHADEELAFQAVATARTLAYPKGGVEDLKAALLRVAREPGIPVQTRLDALAALPGEKLALEPELFDFVRAQAAPDKPVRVRGTAAGVLSRSELGREQLLALTETLKAAGPLELGKILAPFEGESDEKIGLALAAALKESAGLSGLTGETVRRVLSKFPESVQELGRGLITLLDVDAEQQRARLEELARSLGRGDVRRGQAIFNSEKTACASCHSIGYLGGNLGPDLTRIGQIRTERDLLEAIVFPSASFVRSYEPIVVVTRDGEEYSGVLRGDGPEEIVLATGPAVEIRISRDEIAEMRPGKVSVMPGGLDEQLDRQELADLVAFLKAAR